VIGSFRSVAVFVTAVLWISLAVGAGAGELVDGGGFESGGFAAAWVHSGGNYFGRTNPAWADHDVVLDLPFSGNYSALLGFKYTEQRRNRFGFMYQDVTIPSNISSAVLSFKFRQQGYDGANYDPFLVDIRNPGGGTLATVVDYSFSEWNNQFKDSGWIDDDGIGHAGYDMISYEGRTVRLYFRQDNSWDNLYETWTFVDDVSLVFRRWIDLAVDGHGDDIFGDLGTGDGGTAARSGEAGNTIDYMLDIENEGPDTDSYTLSISIPSGWSAVISYGGSDHTLPWTTPPMASGTSIQATVRLTIASGESDGEYESILDAVSTSYGNRFDSVKLVTLVVPAYHLADLAIDANGVGVIDPLGGGGIAYREAFPDTEVTFSVDLMNSGSRVDSFLVWFSPASPLSARMEEGAMIHYGPFISGHIDAGGSSTYTLRVTVPSGIGGGDYATTVFARSMTDSLMQDGVQGVTRVNAPKVDIVICGSGDDVIDPTGSGLGGSSTIAGVPGNTLFYPLILQNEGGVVDSFTLDWTAPGGGWSATIIDGVVIHGFPWITRPFEPFSERSYVLAVTIPGGASYDTYISILDAVSMADGSISESVTAGITVSSQNETDLLIDGSGDDTYGPLGTGLGGSSIQTANPGDTVTFTIEVQNESGEDLFDLMWNTPSGWEVVIGDSTSTMMGVTSGYYTLEVRIPQSCPGGTFDVIIDGQKTNKKFLVDSVRGRILVSFPCIVDALIDGDGDEVFGTPGAGDGGHSQQNTLGGRTVNFTIELQNQGGDAESYTVDWNGFAGWTATLESSPPPHTTSAIPAGSSGLLVFEVVIPSSAAEGDYDFIIDVASTADPGNVESVTARIHVHAPPQVDLIIEGDGAFDTAPSGTGEGGKALIFGDPGVMVTAVLEVHNRGGFPDSFLVDWEDPDGWPSGSVLIFDGLDECSSPFVTEPVDPGESVSFIVRVYVPADARPRSRVIMDAVAMSMDLEDSILLEVATGVFFVGCVFNDLDHDGSLDPGEPGWGGVTVTLSDPGGGIVASTGADGSYCFEVASGGLRQVLELTPSGMISLSPDTVTAGPASAGDTVTVDFADVALPSISPGNEANGPAGGIVDLPHMVTAGTAGQAVLFAAVPDGWIASYYKDNNGNGLVDGSDTRLTSADLDLDPGVPGRDVVRLIVRLYIPPQAPGAMVACVALTLEQTLGCTSIVVGAGVTDKVLVLANASGMLRLVKEVDLGRARPGDTVTYTIVFSNPGIEGVREIEITDPVSESVELVTGGFGPGRDIAWISGSGTVYLTADPDDADEAMYDPSERLLRIVLSRQIPFVLESGEKGRIVYMVRIR